MGADRDDQGHIETGSHRDGVTGVTLLPPEINPLESYGRLTCDIIVERAGGGSQTGMRLQMHTIVIK